MSAACWACGFGFYYKEDDGIRTLVYYETEAGDNRTFRIDPEDLIGYENERLSYYKDGRGSRRSPCRGRRL